MITGDFNDNRLVTMTDELREVVYEFRGIIELGVNENGTFVVSMYTTDESPEDPGHRGRLCTCIGFSSLEWRRKHKGTKYEERPGFYCPSDQEIVIEHHEHHSFKCSFAIVTQLREELLSIEIPELEIPDYRKIKTRWRRPKRQSED